MELPQHKLYYVITGVNISGPRQYGEVIDVDDLQIRHAVYQLESAGAIRAVPYGSDLVDHESGIVFVGQEFADEYQAMLDLQAGVVEDEEDEGTFGEGSDDNSEDTNDGGQSDQEQTADPDEGNGIPNEDGEVEGEDVQERLSRIGNMNKVNMTAEAESLGITVDPEWTKADIMNAMEAALVTG